MSPPKPASSPSSGCRRRRSCWIPVRAHWGIENPLHWQPDVSSREGAARNRNDNGPGNIAVLRRRALDVVRRDTSKGKLSIKFERAGWDNDFLRKDLDGLAEA